MTITPVWGSGVELNDLTKDFDGTAYSGANTVSASANAKKNGSYGLQDYYPTGGGANVSSAYLNLPSFTQMRLGWWFNLASLGNAVNSNVRDPSMLALYAGSTRRLTIYFPNTGAYNPYPTTALLLDGTQRLNFNNLSYRNIWEFWTLDCKFSASSGWVAWYRNSNLVGVYSGNTGASAITVAYFGSYPELGTGIIRRYPSHTFYYDNLFIENTSGELAYAPMTPKHFVYLPANDAGNYSEFVPNSAVANYTTVDEIPPNGDTDYNAAVSSGVRDSYKVASLPSAPDVYPSSSIRMVIPTVVVRDVDSRQTQIKLGTRLGSTNLVGSAQDIPIAYGIIKQEFQSTKPGGGAWDLADIGSTEVYIESAGLYG